MPAKGATARSASKPRPRRKRSARPRKGAGFGGRRKSGKGTPILHTCGHTQFHALGRRRGPSEIEYHAKQPCTACWSEAQALEAEAAAGFDELPPLEGTPRQVSWARAIRGQVLARIKGEAARVDRMCQRWGEEPAAAKLLALALPSALEQRKAKWWIENRPEGSALEAFLPESARQQLEELMREPPF